MYKVYKNKYSFSMYSYFNNSEKLLFCDIYILSVANSALVSQKKFYFYAQLLVKKYLPFLHAYPFPITNVLHMVLWKEQKKEHIALLFGIFFLQNELKKKYFFFLSDRIWFELLKKLRSESFFKCYNLSLLLN